jgi:hypothetical protein
VGATLHYLDNRGGGMPSIKHYVLSNVEEPVYIDNYADLLSLVYGEASFEAKTFLQYQWDCDVFVLLPKDFSSVEHISRHGWGFLFLDNKQMSDETVGVWLDLANELGFKVAVGSY